MVGFLRSYLFIFVAFCLMAASAAQASALKAEVARIDNSLGSGYAGVRAALNDLRWSGIQDEAIYDQLAALLEANMEASDKESVERNAWYVKGLGYSGLKKYETLIDTAVDSGISKLARHAKKARTNLAKYAVWNPVIARDNAQLSTQQALDEQRVLNMLTSGLPELNRVAAKQVHFEYASNSRLLTALEQQLLRVYKSDGLDSLDIDAIAWMCKALGKSANSDFADTLTEVSEQSPSSKVKKHARKALRQLSN